jgi:hypothetical protein
LRNNQAHFLPGTKFPVRFVEDRNMMITLLRVAAMFAAAVVGGMPVPAAAETSPVYRFFNSNAGGHFYTISEAEKNTVLANYSWLRYEGAGFYAASGAQAGMSPVYRFFNSNAGGHFYTISEAEKNTVLANYPWLRYEGIGFYAYASAMPASPVVDTGQSKSYNATGEIPAPAPGQAFYGQDAQHAGNQPGFVLSGDGRTVLDQVTGLTWMRGPNTTLAAPVAADKKTYSAAQAWVATVNAMNYGGFGDWRLPTIKELYSLMNFNGTDPSSYTGSNTAVLTPFIDTAYFNFGYGQTSQGERIIDSQYVSSTVFVVNPAETGSAKVFGLNLADGRIKGYDLTMPGNGEKTFFVQLVRGTAGYGNNSFASNGDGTVTDSATGLMWSGADSGSGMTWQEALAWVQARNAANHLGHNDWRLPNAKELHTLVNYANAPDFNGKPAIDTAYFSCTAIVNENGETDYPYYWTSTTHAGYSASGSAGSQAVYIPFGRALGWPDGASRWVDVHGAGAQRSDPKIGPPYSYATARTVGRNGITYAGYAFGPQGDALRGLNYVRLVR